MKGLKIILNDLDKNGGKEFHSLENVKAINERFNRIFQEWLEKCKTGEMKSIENISLILKNELIQRERLGERRSIKKQNSFEIIIQFKNKLRYLAFEIAKRNNEEAIIECECKLRLLFKIEPKMENMRRYGIAFLYHIDEDYTIHECKVCKTKWIKDDYSWLEWNSKEYTFKKNHKSKTKTAINND